MVFMPHFTVVLMLIIGIPAWTLAQLPDAPSAVSTSTAPLSLTLDAAVELALFQNRNLQQQTYNVRSSDLGRSIARSEFLPRIVPDTGVGVNQDGNDSTIGAGVAKKNVLGTEIKVGAALEQFDGAGEDLQNRGRAGIQLQQPLFRRFGPLVQKANLLDAESSFRSAQRRLEDFRATLVIDTVQSYENILRYEKQLEADQAFHTRIERLYRLTRAREHQGRTTRVDSLRVELQLGEAKARLTRSIDLLLAENRKLAELLGMEPDAKLKLEPEPLPAFDIPQPEVAVDIALSNRMDYAQIIDDASDADRAARIARRTVWPDINLDGRYERSGADSSASGSFDFDDEDWFLGVTLASDVNPTRDRAERGQSEFAYRSALEQVDIQRIAITRAVRDSVSNLMRAELDHQTATRNHELASNRALLARRLFEIGKGDNFSVTDAEQAFIQAENQLYGSKVNLAMAVYSLRRELGTVLDHPEHLKPPAAARNRI